MKRILPLLIAASLIAPAAAAVPGAEELAEVILTLDTNDDSTLDATEFREGTDSGFDEIDRDADGQITAAEVDALGTLIGHEQGSVAGALVPAMIKVMLMTMDKDGNKLVSREEYRAGAQRIFTMLDANKDDLLTRAELTSLPAQLVKAAVK